MVSKMACRLLVVFFLIAAFFGVDVSGLYGVFSIVSHENPVYFFNGSPSRGSGLESFSTNLFHNRYSSAVAWWSHTILPGLTPQSLLCRTYPSQVLQLASVCTSNWPFRRLTRYTPRKMRHPAASFTASSASLPRARAITVANSGWR